MRRQKYFDFLFLVFFYFFNIEIRVKLSKYHWVLKNWPNIPTILRSFTILFFMLVLFYSFVMSCVNSCRLYSGLRNYGQNSSKYDVSEVFCFYWLCIVWALAKLWAVFSLYFLSCISNISYFSLITTSFCLITFSSSKLVELSS